MRFYKILIRNIKEKLEKRDHTYVIKINSYFKKCNIKILNITVTASCLKTKPLNVGKPYAISKKLENLFII